MFGSMSAMVRSTATMVNGSLEGILNRLTPLTIAPWEIEATHPSASSGQHVDHPRRKGADGPGRRDLSCSTHRSERGIRQVRRRPSTGSTLGAAARRVSDRFATTGCGRALVAAMRSRQLAEMGVAGRGPSAWPVSARKSTISASLTSNIGPGCASATAPARRDRSSRRGEVDAEVARGVPDGGAPSTSFALDEMTGAEDGTGGACPTSLCSRTVLMPSLLVHRRRSSPSS